MSKPSPAPLFPTTPSTPRARRGDAAVVWQYIQDLSHPADAGERAAAR